MPVQAPSAPQGPARFPGPCIKRCPGGCNCPGEQAGLERPQRQWYKQSTKAQTQSFPLKIQTQVMLNNVKQLIRQRLPEAALRPTSSMPYTGSKTSSFTGKRCRATALTKAPGRDPPVWCPVLPTEQERNAREGVNCLMLLNAAVTRRPTQETIKRPTQSPHHTQSPPTPHHTTPHTPPARTSHPEAAGSDHYHSRDNPPGRETHPPAHTVPWHSRRNTEPGFPTRPQPTEALRASPAVAAAATWRPLPCAAPAPCPTASCEGQPRRQRSRGRVGPGRAPHRPRSPPAPALRRLLNVGSRPGGRVEVAGS